MKAGDVYFLPSGQQDKWATSVRLLREVDPMEWECEYLTPKKRREDRQLYLTERFLDRWAVTAYIGRQK